MITLVDSGRLEELVQYVDLNGGWSDIIRLMRYTRWYKTTGNKMSEYVLDKIGELYYLVLRWYEPNGTVDWYNSKFYACDDVVYLYSMYHDFKKEG